MGSKVKLIVENITLCIQDRFLLNKDCAAIATSTHGIKFNDLAPSNAK